MFEMDDADRWPEEHPNVMAVLVDRPPVGSDWRSQDGWGRIFKAGFAHGVSRAKGWKRSAPGAGTRASGGESYGCQLLMSSDGQSDFVLARRPEAKIQRLSSRLERPRIERRSTATMIRPPERASATREAPKGK